MSDGETPVYQSAEWLDEQHNGLGLSTREMAEKAGCGQSTISRWMDKLDVDTRDKATAQRERYGPPRPRVQNGYVYFRCQCGDSDARAGVHQLVAIANGADPYKVFSGKTGGWSTHHDNRVRWDNRPENVDVLSVEDHGEISAADRHGRPTPSAASVAGGRA